MVGDPGTAPKKLSMTNKGIDPTVKTPIEADQAGRLRSPCRGFNASLHRLVSGEVETRSMRSPALSVVRPKGSACSSQRWKQGNRVQAAGFGLPAIRSGEKRDGAHLNEFVGAAGAGHAVAVLQRRRAGPARRRE